MALPSDNVTLIFLHVEGEGGDGLGEGEGDLSAADI